MITYEWSDWRNGTVCGSRASTHHPRAPRRGVYAASTRTSKRWSSRSGDPRIRLYVDDRNKPAKQVYTRLGMNGEHYRCSNG